ncbi:MAG TPA: hypothetical protein VJ963_05215, partial [Bacteroidales bacterium]|nr:hypothetical protein [Bacteroidales bacterium]
KKEKKYKNPAPVEVGLFGALPGITGAYMANEVIKMITGTGNVIAGKILLIDVFNNTFHTFTVNNNPGNHRIKSLH